MDMHAAPAWQGRQPQLHCVNDSPVNAAATRVIFGRRRFRIIAKGSEGCGRRPALAEGGRVARPLPRRSQRSRLCRKPRVVFNTNDESVSIEASMIVMRHGHPGEVSSRCHTPNAAAQRPALWKPVAGSAGGPDAAGGIRYRRLALGSDGRGGAGRVDRFNTRRARRQSTSRKPASDHADQRRAPAHRRRCPGWSRLFRSCCDRWRIAGRRVHTGGPSGENG